MWLLYMVNQNKTPGKLERFVSNVVVFCVFSNDSAIRFVFPVTPHSILPYFLLFKLYISGFGTNFPFV